jgi:hypothetical protein
MCQGTDSEENRAEAYVGIPGNIESQPDRLEFGAWVIAGFMLHGKLYQQARRKQCSRERIRACPEVRRETPVVDVHELTQSP